MGGGTSPFLDEPLSPVAHSLGQEAAELSSVFAFRLWSDCVSGRWVIQIGTYWVSFRAWLLLPRCACRMRSIASGLGRCPIGGPPRPVSFLGWPCRKQGVRPPTKTCS